MRAAIYTRVSKDDQRETSHDDQARNCQNVIDREGWKLVHRYTDHGISGAKTDRPQYQAMLAAAKRGDFEVLLIDKLSRFARDLVEQERSCNVLTFAGIRVIAVGDGYDSSVKKSKLMRQIHGVMNEDFREDLAHNVHRGLDGAARRGLSVGGRAYGYRSEPIVEGSKVTGYRVLIDEEQAAHVRWIFERYAEGLSPRKIAGELNRRGVPSPGASWARIERRKDGKWLASTIYGDPERWSGILHNELYTGVRVWNRSKRFTDPETGKTVFRERPETDFVRVAVPHLRIIDDALWAKARAREAAIRERYGAGISAAIRAGKTTRREQVRHARRALKPGKYFLTGLVRCHECGASYVVSGGYQTYRCASLANGGEHACGNRTMIKKADLEERLVAGIRDELGRPEWVTAFEAEVRRVLAEQAGTDEGERARRMKRLAEVTRKKENLLAAILDGIRTPTTKAELEALEADEAKLMAAPRSAEVIRLLPKAAERFRRLVRDLPATLAKEPERARAELEDLTGGKIVLRPDATGLVAEVPLAAMANLLNRKGNIRIGSGGRI